MEKKNKLPNLDIETLVKVTELAASDENWKSKLDQIITFARKQFVFDNIVIYISEFETKRLDPFFARATGRGKSAEADVSWGEAVATRVAAENCLILETPDPKVESDRLKSPFILGLPINLSHDLSGVLVVVRFGGPQFTEDSISFAEFLTGQISAIIKQKCLDDLMVKIKSQQNMSRLQEDFISNISHELRNPLGFIKGYTTTLMRQDAHWDQKTQYDFLEIIERETNNLTELIDNLLDSSLLHNGQMKFDFQPMQIESIIKDEINRAKIIYPNQIVHLQIENKISLILGDTHRLAQVIRNLLTNASKYAPQAEVQIHVMQKGKSAVIEFKDFGPGISEKYLPHIFTRFFRDPENSIQVHGSGLGLSISKQIIEKHNGEISVSSPDNSGAIFRITLPGLELDSK